MQMFDIKKITIIISNIFKVSGIKTYAISINNDGERLMSDTKYVQEDRKLFIIMEYT